MRPDERCQHCSGRGEHPLRATLWAALRILRRRPTSTAVVADKLGIQHTAAVNRLNALVGLGLARRSRPGNAIVWEAT